MAVGAGGHALGKVSRPGRGSSRTESGVASELGNGSGLSALEPGFDSLCARRSSQRCASYSFYFSTVTVYLRKAASRQRVYFGSPSEATGLSCPSSVKPPWKQPLRQAQRCVSQAIANPAMLTLKMNYHKEEGGNVCKPHVKCLARKYKRVLTS